MNNNPFNLSVPEDQKPYIKAWIWIGVTALAIAGLFVVLVVVQRTPVLQDILPGKASFKTALVEHVNLSVLVWLLSGINIALHSFIFKAKSWFHQLAIIVFVLGLALMTIAPFVGKATPYLNNYIPMLESNVFVVGLVCLAFGMAMQALKAASIFSLEATAVRHSLLIIIIGVALAIITIALSAYTLSLPDYEGLFLPKDYYELLYWAGGHLLQFPYTFLMLICWVVLGQQIIKDFRFPTSLFIIITAITGASMLLTPVIFFQYEMTDYEFKHRFTQHMIVFGGLASAVAGLAIAKGLLFNGILDHKHPAKHCLYYSFLLFTFGGLLGLLIEGSNVTIPAHYHGSTIGVTIAVMGLIYALLPQLGYKPVSYKAAKWQSIFYGGGQLLHITGLGISGGYGVMRKHPEAYAGAEIQIYMGMVGLGGFLAIIGGIIFVILLLQSLTKPVHIAPKKGTNI